MKETYISTKEIIAKYGVSNVTVAKWIREAVEEKNQLNYDTVGKRSRILNIPENWYELDTLGDQALATGSLVQGTNFGQDLTTQITTFTQDDTLILERAVTQSTKLSLNISQGYTIILLQDGKTQQVLINGGGDSTIKITQGSG